ncbi:hypothetical protein GY45DRAFT_1168888 [Cubamyces sp. BRFM 1775]|nr:hypothetical protein GY45DRAFT_1168888 [Cubamyces sp. BRFM 1775]
MSLSTCDFCSDRSSVTSSSSTTSETRTSDQPPAWHDTIQRKVHPYGNDIDEYFRAFVPSRTPCNVNPPSLQLVEGWDPRMAKEEGICDPLVTILTSIVKDFPEDRKPSFCDSRGAMFPFPFSHHADRHHSARPDLVASFPGDKLPARMNAPDWSRVSMLLQVKDVAGDDPFVTGTSEDSKDRAERLVQLAVDARNLMFANGFLAAYVFGVYGSNVRIARFDHACVVVSPVLHLKSAEGLRSIQEFFWRFVHPWEGGPGAVVGCDTTFRKLTPADEAWLRAQLADEAEEVLAGVDLLEARTVKVYDDDKPEEPKTFMLFKLFDVNTRLFSRATMVWLCIEDTRTACASTANGDTGGPAALCVLKESWRQLNSIPEQKFYQRLSETIPAGEWHGLPKLLHGGDLGIRDLKRWDAARCGKPWSGKDDLLAGTSASSASSTPSTAAYEDIPHPMHQTYSLRLCDIDNAERMERSHVRLVVNTVGRPLSRFKSTKELVMAMRDAIQGHQLATKYGRLLHRDISSGNILIVDRPIPDNPHCKGVLHDFDYSWMFAARPCEEMHAASSEDRPLPDLEIDEDATLGANSEKLKVPTGTYYFIAHDIIDPSTVTPAHDVCHDLESCYWALLWLVLRHTECVSGYTCAELFRFGDDRTAAMWKHCWAHRLREMVTVINNQPLTALLHHFKRLVFLGLRDPEIGGPVPLTYEAVLRLFDEAIAREDWPSDDQAIPYKPDGPSRTKSALPAPIPVAAAPTPASKTWDKENKKRKRDHDVDERKSGAAALEPPLDTASTTAYSGTSMIVKRPKRSHAGSCCGA